MPRHDVKITITAGGSKAANRDYGKVFKITEMAAIPADEWATKALFGLAQAGLQMSPEMMSNGMLGFASLLGGAGTEDTMLLFMKYDQAKPLMEALLQCVQIVEPSMVRDLTADDIEETTTFFTLRREALKLHTAFFLQGGQSTTSTSSASSSA